MARKYELKRRAARQEETRRRIVEAAVALHETGETSISAIAARAGVERPTVYRHFPDERALLTACTGHYLALHPPPDPAAWRDIADAHERLRVALAAVSAYHRETAAMTAQALRGVETSLVLREALAPLVAYWEEVRESLLPGWPQGGATGRAVRAALGFALDFQTWRSLTGGQGLTDGEAVDLLVEMVAGIGGRPSIGGGGSGEHQVSRPDVASAPLFGGATTGATTSSSPPGLPRS